MAGVGDDGHRASKRSSPPSWPDLPPDVLRLIACYLTTIWDYLRFRGVCSSFRSAADSPPTTPSLLLPYDPASASRSFLDPSDRSVHTLLLPETRRNYLYGTPHGWLVLLSKRESPEQWIFTVSLLNPITRDHILLPPLPLEITHIPELHSSDYRRFTHCTKPVLTSAPAPTTLLALLIFSDLVVCRLGSGGTWTVVRLGTPSAPHRLMLDLAYFDNAFYVVDDSTGITVVSTKSLKKRYSAPPQYSRPIPVFNDLYLVESLGGLLMVEVLRGGYDPKVKVSRLDRGEGSGNGGRKLKWVGVTGGIGDTALFLSSTHSSISRPSSEFMRGWGPDVVCFTRVDRKDDEKYGDVHELSVCAANVLAGGGVAYKPYYWEHIWRVYPRGENLIGVSWILLSLRPIENDGSLLLAVNRVPGAAGDGSAVNDPTRGIGEEGRWPDLPTDVLLFISQKLGSPWDYVRFRGVCSAWRLAASPGFRVPPQIPSLLLPYDLTTTTRSFYDLSDSRVHTIDLPEARGKWLYGTPYGWLVMLGEEEKEDGWMFSASLLNPVTRAHILFPPLPLEITRLPEQQMEGNRNKFSSKPLLTGNPASSPEVLLGLLIYSRLVFCKLGQDEAWTVTDLRIPSAPRRIMCEFTYFDGAFYVVDVSKGVTVLSTNPVKKKYSAPRSTRPIPDHHTLHLVELYGDLLLLEIHKIGVGTLIEVEKLDRSSKKLKWVRVEHSMSGALFVSHNHSSISLCPRNVGASGRGFICFANDESKYEGKFGTVNKATVCMSYLDSGISIGREPYYWQGSRRAPTYGSTSIGLSWIMPSPC